MQELLRLYLTAAATQGIRCQTTGTGFNQEGKTITVTVGHQDILVDKEIGFVRIYLKPYVQHRACKSFNVSPTVPTKWLTEAMRGLRTVSSKMY